jgi:glycine/D-amino acid oxidase-like deaminating enzyme
LTQAATTGALIRDLIQDQKPAIDLAPFDIARFKATVATRRP